MDTWEESFNTTFGGPHLANYQRMSEDFNNRLKSIEEKNRTKIKGLAQLVCSTYDESTGRCALQLKDDKLPPKVVAEIKKAYKNIFEVE